MHICNVCGNDATTTLYVEGSYEGDTYTLYACSPECESEILGTVN